MNPVREVANLAENKAWDYFYKLLDDKEKYYTFTVLKKPIEIKGNKNGRFFLYPSGRIVDLDDSNPKLGGVVMNQSMASPDFLSTVLLWITQKEEEFRKVWACGNLSIFYAGKEQKSDPLRNVDTLGHFNSTAGTSVICGTFSAWYPGSLCVMGT